MMLIILQSINNYNYYNYYIYILKNICIYFNFVNNFNNNNYYYSHFVDFLKIDIESASVKVLKTIFDNLLYDQLPLMIMVEVKSGGNYII